MCVIAIKPKDTALPSDEIIKQMWDRNKDGAGFMYVKDKKVVISKGYMNYDDLKKALTDLSTEVDIFTTPVVLHFRITTHGGTSAENTHPFPVSDKEEHLKALDVICQIGMAHNGIISSVPKEDTLSDTQIYIRDIITPLVRISSTNTFLEKYKTLIDSTSGASRLVFLDNDGNLVTFGNFTEENGIKYSNTTFKPTITYTKTYTYPSSSAWDDYDYSYKINLEKCYKLKATYGYSAASYRVIDLDDVVIPLDVDPSSSYTSKNIFFSLKKQDYVYDVPQYMLVEALQADIDKYEDAELFVDVKSHLEEFENKKDIIKDDIVVIEKKNNIGGKKNKETADLEINGNRSLMKKMTLDSPSLISYNKGVKLIRTDSQNKEHLFEVKSDNWFYSFELDGVVYKTKSGDYVFVEELSPSFLANDFGDVYRPKQLTLFLT